MTAVRASKTLAALLGGYGVADCPAVAVSGVAADSRRVVSGDLFLAWGGLRGHGLDHLDQAIARGAVAVVHDGAAGQPPQVGVPVVRVSGLRARAGEIAARFHDHPDRSLRLVGITGTDGKTSCAHIIAQACAALAWRCGYIGTLGSGLADALTQGTHTTPDAVALAALLAELRDAGARMAALEVSSHALDQDRVAGLKFAVAVLTNIGRDHLDYHGDMTHYVAAKRRLFVDPACAVLNIDDQYGAAWAGELASALPVVAYGLNGVNGCSPAVVPPGVRHVIASEVLTQPQGLVLGVHSSWGELRVESALLGRFNAYNLIAALAVLLVEGVAPETAAAALARVTTVRGRMEAVATDAGRPLVVVDYAHTPGALEQALRALGEHVAGRIFCVFGCGGDRDAGKRPLMARAAAAHSDALWITDDNPRSEAPQAIVDDILAGLPAGTPATVEHDRASAIAAAITAAGPQDAVLIAGKGHETTQIIGEDCRAFDDRQAARAVLEAA